MNAPLRFLKGTVMLSDQHELIAPMLDFLQSFLVHRLSDGQHTVWMYKVKSWYKST